VARFKFHDAWQRLTARSASEIGLAELDNINDEAAAKILREFRGSAEKTLPSPKKTSPERSDHRQNRRIPKLLKAVLCVGISGFLLFGIWILPATASEGWAPAIALLAALGLVIAVLTEIKRSK
jgi:hypothetical protein